MRTVIYTRSKLTGFSISFFTYTHTHRRDIALERRGWNEFVCKVGPGGNASSLKRRGTREILQRRAGTLFVRFGLVRPMSATPSQIWPRAGGEFPERTVPCDGFLASANTCVMPEALSQVPPVCRVSPIATVDSSQKHWQLPSHVSDLIQGQLLLCSVIIHLPQRLSSVLRTSLPKHQFFCVRLFLVVVV